MLFLSSKPQLYSLGYQLNCHPNALGELRDSSGLLGLAAQLRQRMFEDGYLYLSGFLNPQMIWQARLELAESLATEGFLLPQYAIEHCVAKPGLTMSFRPDLVAKSPTLQKLLYTNTLLDFFEVFLGGEILHYDYTWLRAVSPNLGTYPHCDIVYMGRGTPNLYTVWTPLGDISSEMGGLMILENSHQIGTIKNSYGQRDVDSYCQNRKQIKWWDGALSKNPVSLQKRYGGRWLTTQFKAGDILIFSMFTVHGSLDNQSPYIRLSSDSRYQLASEPVDQRWLGKYPSAHSQASKQGKVC
ncbi:MAG: phytanoyl-CoA dioxygenase family protein [Coleofasciculaceae cyanobacterium]